MQTNRGIIATIFLTLVALLVFLFAIGYFTSSHPFGGGNYKKALHLPCGLTLSAPKDNTLVTFPYKVFGYAGGCGWDPVNYGTIGTVEILGPNGLVLARADLTTKDVVGDTPYYFEKTIDVPVSFVAETGQTGYFIIHNSLYGLNAKEIRIPIHFSSRL